MLIYKASEQVRRFAIYSRVVVLLIQVISNLILPDHEADAFISPIDPELPISIADRFISVVLGGFKRWDAHYFLHIAQYGYSHENTLAFFPLFPMAVRAVGVLLHLPLQLFLNYHSCLLLGAFLLNFCLFVKTAVILYKLSRLVLQNDELAYKSAILFCINPASIFFSAPYSEALFAFLTFSAFLQHEVSRSFLITVPFGLASATRSNGLINIGFLSYRKLQDCTKYYHKLRNATTDSGPLNIIIVIILTFNYALIPATIGILVVILPFFLFQFWCYVTYCKEDGSTFSLQPHLELFIRSNFLHSPDLGEAEWCYNSPPLAYSHIQEKYWEVGLLKYYELKQLPNFLLALPLVMIVICHAALYMVDNSQICLNAGIPPARTSRGGESRPAAWQKGGINSWRVFVYTVHALGLCIFCVLCINVQVTTRLLCSSSPVAYWFAAHLISSEGGDDEGSFVKEGPSTPKGSRPRPLLAEEGGYSLMKDFPRSFWGQVVLSYFLFYFIIGTILFANFLPWT